MLVTVYLPTRNRVDLLAKAVDSVLRQTHNEIELIVVNDASTDATADFLCQRSLVDSRLIHFNNAVARGAPASRNLAIDKAKGAFVTGLDDDDEFLPERIGAFVDYWRLLEERGGRPACLFAQDIVFRNGEYLVTKRRGNVTAEDLFELNMLGNQIFAPKSHYVEVGSFDEQLPAWQDLDLFIRILSRFGRGHLLDMPTYLYDDSPRHDRISTRSKNVRDAADILIEKYAASSPRDSQRLFLQIFQKHYGNRPSISDWTRFWGWGIWPRGTLQLLRATLRREGKS
jgi:glycosyltransferase involved in cell wall biosynthesis